MTGEAQHLHSSSPAFGHVWVLKEITLPCSPFPTTFQRSSCLFRKRKHITPISNSELEIPFQLLPHSVPRVLVGSEITSSTVLYSPQLLLSPWWDWTIHSLACSFNLDTPPYTFCPVDSLMELPGLKWLDINPAWTNTVRPTTHVTSIFPNMFCDSSPPGSKLAQRLGWFPANCNLHRFDP